MSGSVTVCIVNHDGGGRLLRVVDAASALGDSVAEVLVVDSGSEDGSPERLARERPEIRTVRLGANLGPAAARNRGLDEAAGDRVLFLDNDVFPDPDCLGRLESALDAREGAVLAMPRVVDDAEPGRVHFEGADAHCLGQLAPRRSVTEGGGAASAVEVGSMVSACFLVDRRRLGALRFDEGFEFNYEDHDFGLRCRIAGLALLAVPGARCRHGGGTPGYSARDGRPDPPGRVRRLVAGRWMILWKCYARRTLVLLAPALALYEAVQLAWVVRAGRYGEWREAVAELLGRRAELGALRHEVRASRRARDGSLLVGGPLPVREGLATGSVERSVLRLLGAFASGWWRLVRAFS
mgnify:FL=1